MRMKITAVMAFLLLLSGLTVGCMEKSKATFTPTKILSESIWGYFRCDFTITRNGELILEQRHTDRITIYTVNDNAVSFRFQWDVRSMLPVGSGFYASFQIPYVGLSGRPYDVVMHGSARTDVLIEHVEYDQAEITISGTMQEIFFGTRMINFPENYECDIEIEIKADPDTTYIVHITYCSKY